MNYSLGKPALEENIFNAEKHLNLTLPEQVKMFYESYNGLSVKDPQLEIFPLENLYFVTHHKLNFATIDGKHQIYFNTSKINEAGQWNIISEEDYFVTKTMASFWSNKLWAWIKQRRVIWKEEFYPMRCLIEDSL